MSTGQKPTYRPPEQEAGWLTTTVEPLWVVRKGHDIPHFKAEARRSDLATMPEVIGARSTLGGALTLAEEQISKAEAEYAEAIAKRREALAAFVKSVGA